MPALVLRAIGCLAVLSVAIVSLVPGNLRPHILASGREEHFLAYFVTSCLLAAGFRVRRRRIALGIGLTLCAGAFEVAQTIIAGRTASAADFAAGACGIWIGLYLPFAIRRLRNGDDGCKAVGIGKAPVRTSGRRPGGVG
jgi:VanZ family protein